MGNYDDNKELVEVYRIAKLSESLEQVRQWRKEGKTKEEVLDLIDRRILMTSDVEEIYAEDEEKNNMDSMQTTEDKKENDYLYFLKDEELIDYENQPFSTDNEEENKSLEDSIRLNGIIEPIVVRPYKGKYQILSGHRRRKCGKRAGLDEFPCYVREKSDDEAKLYLVDTNLMTRERIKPTERAKAYWLRKEALKNEKLKEKVDEDIVKDNQKQTLREKMVEENNMSNTNIQRYLRINYLNQELQDEIDSGRIGLQVAETLSFLKKEEQDIISNILKNSNKKINEEQAKILKKDSQNGKLTKEKITKLIDNREASEKIAISFLKEELEQYFDNPKDKKEIKRLFFEFLRSLKQ